MEFFFFLCSFVCWFVLRKGWRQDDNLMVSTSAPYLRHKEIYRGSFSVRFFQPMVGCS